MLVYWLVVILFGCEYSMFLKSNCKFFLDWLMIVLMLINYWVFRVNYNNVYYVGKWRVVVGINLGVGYLECSGEIFLGRYYVGFFYVFSY